MAGAEDTIVVIEDDHHISDLVAMYLRRDGFRVLQADDGEAGLAFVEREGPVLVVVDIGLPGALDGFDVCRRLRGRSGAEAAAPGSGAARHPAPARRDPGRPVPVLILSARDDEVDRVLGLELGADDYVTKPFSPRELVARVRAILRRSAPAAPPASPTTAAVVAPSATYGGVEVDGRRREARRDGEVVALATREFDLLAFLIDNAGLALTRRQLLDGAWGDDWVGDERTVDVHVRQLRKKLGADLPLVTVWGVGYRLA